MASCCVQISYPKIPRSTTSYHIFNQQQSKNGYEIIKEKENDETEYNGDDDVLSCKRLKPYRIYFISGNSSDLIKDIKCNDTFT